MTMESQDAAGAASAEARSDSPSQPNDGQFVTSSFIDGEHSLDQEADAQLSEVLSRYETVSLKYPAPLQSSASPEHRQHRHHHQQQLLQLLGSSVVASTDELHALHPAAAMLLRNSQQQHHKQLSTIQLQCRSLEVALEQQQQRTQAVQQALVAAHAAHAAEEASMRQYYEAQLADRQHELQLLMHRMAAAAPAPADAAAAAPVDSPEAVAAAAQQAADARSPNASTEGDSGKASLQQRPQPATAASPAATGGSPLPRYSVYRRPAAAVAGSSSLTSGVLAEVPLRRELAQAEVLLAGYQEENRAAAKRIKDLESQLSVAKAVLADEAGRAQRAAAAAAEAQRSNGAAAAERLTRQLQLEGQLQELQAQWHEREQELLSQLELARRDKAAAEARAAAAAEGLDSSRWQADDQLVCQLRDQLASQAAAHTAELTALRDKLQWYVENQAFLGSHDDLVSQQADVIRQLEGRLTGTNSNDRATGGGGHAAARIKELEEQVSQLRAALTSRHPLFVPAILAAGKPASDATAAALAAAQEGNKQLHEQLDRQRQQHQHSLRQLQQQYDALKLSLEQQSARQAKEQLTGKQGRVAELTKQLEEQRIAHARRIRTLEARLAAAEGAAAAASRRASNSSSAGSHRKSAANASGQAAARFKGHNGNSKANAQLQLEKESDSFAGDANVAEAAGATNQFAETGAEQNAALDASENKDGALTGLLRVKERQMTGLMAQLEEQTTQFLQLQSKLRAAERQLKQLTAARQPQQQLEQGTPLSDVTNYEDATSTTSEADTPKGQHCTDAPATKQKPAGTRDQRRQVTSENTQDASMARRRPSLRPSKRQDAATAATAKQAVSSDQCGSSDSPHIAAAAAEDGGGAAASWPALCAELEAESNALKQQLAAANEQAAVRDAKVQQLSAQLATLEAQLPCSQQHQPYLGVGGAVSAPAVLLQVADEAAARVAAKWQDRLIHTEEALRSSQSEVAALQHELAMCRRLGSWTPGLATFEELERKLNRMEAAARQQQQSQQQPTWPPAGLHNAASMTAEHNSNIACGSVYGATAAVLFLQQQLTEKTDELDGFRVQVEELLTAAKQLQEQRAAVSVK